MGESPGNKLLDKAFIAAIVSGVNGSIDGLKATMVTWLVSGLFQEILFRIAEGNSWCRTAWASSIILAAIGKAENIL